MNPPTRGGLAGWLFGLVAGFSPLSSFTFLLALGLMGFATWAWLHQPSDTPPPFPVYGTVAASYAGGFLIGRIFRRLLKLLALGAALLIGGLFLLSRTHLDTTRARHAVEAGAHWMEEKTTSAMDYLMHFLPSGGAAGVGVFAGGGRKKSSDATTGMLDP